MTRYALLAAGAVLALSAPAFADETIIPHSGSTVATVIIAPEAPPPAEAEAPPPPPAPTAIWEKGHWRWNPAGQNYTWAPGHYAEPPQEHARWTEGHWAQRPEGWVWMEGHWD